MTFPRVFFPTLAVLTALLLQVSFIARLPWPGGIPDLVLLVVVGFALAEGAETGVAVGFGAGLLTDSLSDHPLGLLALTFCLVGYLVGLAAEELATSTVAILVVVAATAAASLLVAAGVGGLLGDPRYTWSAVAGVLPGGVGFTVLAAPFVVPPIAALCHWLADEERR